MKGLIAHTAEPLTLEIAALLARHDPENRLREYHTALMKENATVNLVSRETTEADFLKLCAESLLPFETELLASQTFGSYLDIGAGGGFPSIPLLLTGKTTGKVILYERTQKKAAALTRILAELKLDAKVFALSFGETRRSDKFSLITLRYVTLDEKLAREIHHSLAGDGIFIYYSKPEIKLPGFVATIYPYQIPPDSTNRHFSIIRPK